jgi:hypothetical protein
MKTFFLSNNNRWFLLGYLPYTLLAILTAVVINVESSWMPILDYSSSPIRIINTFVLALAGGYLFVEIMNKPLDFQMPDQARNVNVYRNPIYWAWLVSELALLYQCHKHPAIWRLWLWMLLTDHLACFCWYAGYRIAEYKRNNEQ